MNRAEIIRRTSLFAGSLTFFVSGILLFKYTNLTKRLLEDADTYEFGNISISALLHCIFLFFTALTALFVSFGSNKSSVRPIIRSLVISFTYGAIIFILYSSMLGTAESQLKKKLSKLQAQYDWGLTGLSMNSDQNATDIWDTLQSDMECCGINSPQDWTKFAPNKDPNALPISCCVNQGPVESSAAPSGTNINVTQSCNSKTMKVHEEGCAVLMKDSISSSTTVLIVSLCVQILLLMQLAWFRAHQQVN